MIGEKWLKKMTKTVKEARVNDLLVQFLLSMRVAEMNTIITYAWTTYYIRTSTSNFPFNLLGVVLKVATSFLHPIQIKQHTRRNSPGIFG